MKVLYWSWVVLITLALMFLAFTVFAEVSGQPRARQLCAEIYGTCDFISSHWRRHGVEYLFAVETDCGRVVVAISSGEFGEASR